MPPAQAEKKRAQQLEMLAGLQTQLDQLTKLQKLHCQRSKPIHVGEALPFSGLHPDLVETQPMDLDAFMLGTPYDAEIKQVQAGCVNMMVSHVNPTGVFDQLFHVFEK